MGRNRLSEAERARMDGISPRGIIGAKDRPPTREMVMRMMAQIPNDTRDITGLIFGDPLPGRSALDRRANKG